MRAFWGNLANELQKLLVRRKYLLFLLFGLIICILSVLASIAVSRSTTYSAAADYAASVPMSMLYIASLMFVPAIIFIAAGDMFAGEFYDYSLQVLLTRPISRMGIYFSKTVALLFVPAVFLLGMSVSSMILEFALSKTVIHTLYALPYYALDFLPLISVVLMAVVLNQFCGNAGVSIAVCALAMLGFYAIQVFVPNAERCVFTNYLVWHNLWIGNVSVRAITQAGITLVLYDVVFFTVGYFKFKTLEI